MKCERCQTPTEGYNLHDYCAKCSKNLCCMKQGCCGLRPAQSGQEAECSDTDDLGVEEVR